MEISTQNTTGKDLWVKPNSYRGKKEGHTHHSANSIASGRGKGMVWVCCVHPAIAEERKGKRKRQVMPQVESGVNKRKWGPLLLLHTPKSCQIQKGYSEWRGGNLK